MTKARTVTTATTATTLTTATTVTTATKVQPFTTPITGKMLKNTGKYGKT